MVRGCFSEAVTTIARALFNAKASTPATDYMVSVPCLTRPIPMNEHAKNVLDGVSVATAVATLAAWLPPLAALASLVWTVIRILETKTVQGWLRKWRKADGL
jgi:hypothetical protein